MYFAPFNLFVIITATGKQTPRHIALDDVFKLWLNSVLGIVEKKVFKFVSK